MEDAQKKVADAKIIFTTCTGAALGLLRKLTFAYVIVDEASQITEPNCLIVLAKGCQKVVLVGDHVQLRPNVTPLGEAYGCDMSLFERLYREPDVTGVAKTMLDTQYRMHPEIARFPSKRFYEERLLSGVTADERNVPETNFDWHGKSIKFIDAPGLSDGQESNFHRSKSNRLQAQICRDIVLSLQQSPSRIMDGALARSHKAEHSSTGATLQKLSVAILTPYTAQVKLLQSLSKTVDSPTVSSITVSTVDSFQGREADVVIFCTVRLQCR